MASPSWAKPSCFDACSTCNLHTTGRWVPRSPSSPPGYRLNYSLWASLGLSGPPPTSSSHYGLCDDVMANLGLGPRPLYEWEADACELPRFDVAHACAVLEGKQVVVAGDSTAGQLFLSLVMQLGGLEDGYALSQRHLCDFFLMPTPSADSSYRHPLSQDSSMHATGSLLPMPPPLQPALKQATLARWLLPRTAPPAMEVDAIELG